ncbi:MAG: cysteine desulfurase NifS [Syntrophus sp. (in: bacteria)]|nr:cysteine desulfurase NifS [Syntrophus sp. (in: bacteria)]
MHRVYLDNNATTPIHPDVAAALKPFLDEVFGNPSSIHWGGREAKTSIDKARDQIADMIQAKPAEIIITGSGTESDNYAIKGVAYGQKGRGNHIITTTVEHPGVLNTYRYLEAKGFRVTYLPVDSYGLIDPGDVKKAIGPDTMLISVMYANNETGTLFPIGEIGKIAREEGVLFHSDMVQAMGKVDIDIESLNVDLASFSGHKVYAPKGVGALYMREGLEIDSLIHGGHQEAGRRAGTENVIGIVAFGCACEVTKREMQDQNRRIDDLREKLFKGILERVDRVGLNGHPTLRLPNTLNLAFESVEAESFLIALDLQEIAVSAGAACSAGAIEPSHVLLAMGRPSRVCQSAMRFSLGRENTEDDIDYALSVIPETVNRLRKKTSTQ